MDLEQQLRAALVPCRPVPGLRAMVLERVSAAARGKSRGTGKPGRFFVVGIVLAAAAAALLVMRPREAAAPPVATVTQGPPPPPEVHAAPASPPPAVMPAPQPMRVDATPKPTVLPAKAFTVRVAFRDTSQAPAKAAVAAYHAAFMDRLRVIPGLVVVAADSPDVAAGTAMDFRITITGAGLDAADKFSAGVQAERLGQDGAVHGNMNGSISGTIVPPCVGPAAADVAMLVSAPTPCLDPATIAAYWVSMLRTRMFPPDDSLRRQLQSQLMDRRLDAQQRLMSMGHLASLRDWSASDAADRAAAKAQFDPEFVRGAIDLAGSATDPALRAQVWRTMRDVRNSVLIVPLLTASREEVDGEARLEAVATLGNFNSDERVRAALESVAGKDSRPLVRAIARRGLAGNDPFREPAWKEYVVSSLKDESRSDAERMEALIYYNFQRGEPGGVANYWIFTSKLLDDDATRALVRMLPGLGASAEWTQPMLVDLARSVASIDHPAVTDMLLQSLQGDARLLARATAVRALLGHGDDPRVRTALQQGSDAGVRAALEQISASDRDIRLRQMAREMLAPQSVESGSTQ